MADDSWTRDRLMNEPHRDIEVFERGLARVTGKPYERRKAETD